MVLGWCKEPPKAGAGLGRDIGHFSIGLNCAFLKVVLGTRLFQPVWKNRLLIGSHFLRQRISWGGTEIKYTPPMVAWGKARDLGSWERFRTRWFFSIQLAQAEHFAFLSTSFGEGVPVPFKSTTPKKKSNNQRMPLCFSGEIHWAFEFIHQHPRGTSPLVLKGEQ